MSASFAPWNLGMMSYSRYSTSISSFATQGTADKRGETHSMSPAERIDIKESEGLLGFHELEARDLA